MNEAKKKFDLQDGLLLVGVAAIVGGVAVWSCPAALILFGLFCLGCVWLMAMGEAIKKAAK